MAAPMNSKKIIFEETMMKMDGIVEKQIQNIFVCPGLELERELERQTEREFENGVNFKRELEREVEIGKSHALS